MNQYFITLSSGCGNLAVEKHLYKYLRLIEHSLINEDRIHCLCEALKGEQDKFFSEHRGKPVGISYAPNNFSNNYHVQVGTICVTLIRVRGIVPECDNECRER